MSLPYWQIYVLVDPRDGETRYVGCTRFVLIARLQGHMSASYSGHSEKGRWIAELKASGLRPLIYEITRTSDYSDKDSLEETWIRRLALAGCKLLNASLRERRIIGGKVLPKVPWVSPYTYWPPVRIPGLPQWEMLGSRVTRRIKYPEVEARL